jgi:hypothetical protein
MERRNMVLSRLYMSRRSDGMEECSSSYQPMFRVVAPDNLPPMPATHVTTVPAWRESFNHSVPTPTLHCAYLLLLQ